VGEDGKGYMSVTTERVTLSPGPTTLFTASGTSLVIHAGPDNQTTNPFGNSGARVACGVIKKKYVFLLSSQDVNLASGRDKRRPQDHELGTVCLHEVAGIAGHVSEHPIY